MSSAHNPFTRSGALRPNHPLFRGRAAELAQLERACLEVYDFFLLIYGGRQNGKTSLLRRLEEQLRTHDAVRVCRVDCQRLPRASAPEVYRYLARSVARTLPLAPPPPDTLDAVALGDFLEQALEHSAVARLVLLLDELGTLPEATRADLADVLRALHDHRLDSPALAKLQVVLAGGIELYRLAVVEKSALRNVCELVRLGDLSEADAAGLITDGLMASGLDAAAAAALGQAVYARVGGHPYLTQRLGAQLADAVLRGERPDLAQVEALVWALLEADDPLLEHLRRSLDELGLNDAARHLLTGSQRTSRTDDVGVRLELLGLARRERGLWVPRNPLLAVALAAWLNLPLPARLPLLEAAVATRQTALAEHLRDLRLEQAATAQRVASAPTIAEHVQLQRRATELADEIARITAAQQVVLPSSAQTPPPPAGSGRTRAQVARLPAWVPTLVHIPAGPFLMGSSDADKQAYAYEKPQHRLELPDFWIGSTPVTNAQFRHFVEGDGYTNPAYWMEAGWAWRQKNNITQPEYWDDARWNGDTQPVVGISWFEAVAYCRWLSAQTGQECRLPSEAEWEKAARGPDGRIWPWGNTWEAQRCNNKEAGVGRTTPVGQYPRGASAYGALDMAGNVWEWCATQRGKRYPYELEDEWGVAYLAADKGRMVRGGAFGHGQENVRGAHRTSLPAQSRLHFIGLRVASRSPPLVSGS